mmetsp:Transcript_100185/g.188780  ORF Transcript_100185/g.188780 Transcript_100185/m.188780 type:complete len:258 (-) Transcript_100185:59-832(-)
MLSGLLADPYTCDSHAESFLLPGPSSLSLRPRLYPDDDTWLFYKSNGGGSSSSSCGWPVPPMLGAPPLHSRGFSTTSLSSFLTVDDHRSGAFLATSYAEAGHQAGDKEEAALAEMDEVFSPPKPPKPKPKLCYHYPGEDPDDETKRPPKPDNELHKVKSFPEKDAKVRWHKFKRFLQFFLLGIPSGFASYGTYLLLKKHVTVPTIEEMKQMIKDAKEAAKKAAKEARDAAKKKGKRGSGSSGSGGGGDGSADAASSA